MARKILSVLFWVVGAFLVGLALYHGGKALVVPGAVLVTLILFALDLYRHRALTVYDRDLLRTLLHVLSAVALAASCLYWLALLLRPPAP